MDQVQIGDFSLTRVEEWRGAFVPPAELFTGYDPALFAAHAEAFAGRYYDPESGRILALLQSWVLRAGGRTIVFDTGAGNAKQRPGIPLFGGLDTPFLSRLQDAGFAPEDIDLVICSHLHIDHVGWNTRLADGGDWLPTFPRARYLFSETEARYWNPAGDGPRPSATGAAVNAGVFEDSVAPLLARGLVDFVGPGDRIGDGLSLIGVPGHTPGHLALRAESRGDVAYFVGDVLHHPIQIYAPDWNSIFCEDAVAARASRRRVLAAAADDNALLIPAHFGGGHMTRVARRDDGFVALDVEGN